MTSDAFPDAKTTQDSVPLLLKPYYGFAATRFGSRCARTVITPIDEWLRRISRGRLTIVASSVLRVMVLETVGRKSGRVHSTALTYILDNDRLLVLGSNFGQAHHPGWSSNLLTDPHASVTIQGAPISVTARLLTGDERQQALNRFRALSIYRQYLSRANREFRLFALTRRPT